ncbi:MAG: ATP-dependent Clp protease ATP-binding subunit ClpA, partial [Lachnospiraceae bacterium]|nr:ATP-dependent Clp protease ATP-binding subunit ClpA [Lachnospiraceae bacterium]
MQVSREVAEIINSVIMLAKERQYELVTPELLLYVICENQLFAEAFEDCGGSIHDLSEQLEKYFNEYMAAVRSEDRMYQAPDQNPEFSAGMGSLLSYAWRSAQGSGRNVVGLMHLIHAMFELEESYAVYYMQLQGVEHAELLQQMTVLHEEMTSARHQSTDAANEDTEAEQSESDDLPEKVWQQFAVCLNDA